MSGLLDLRCVLMLAVLSGVGPACAQEIVEQPAPPRDDSTWIPYGDPSGAARADGTCPGGEYDELSWLLPDFELRHSNTHGRAMGDGGPLRGTSWLNRPYDVAVDFGMLLMADQPGDSVRSNNDFFTALKLGWDWDHYWGTQIRVGWSTPELLNTSQPASQVEDNLFISDLSLLYYPWGDSRLRPYWRVGVGLTDLEYTNRLGARQHEMLLSLPFGVGMKYQFRRWFVWRLELMDNFAVGQNETSSLNNLTITTGFEWRYGGRPSGQWAWSGYGGSW